MFRCPGERKGQTGITRLVIRCRMPSKGWPSFVVRLSSSPLALVFHPAIAFVVVSVSCPAAGSTFFFLSVRFFREGIRIRSDVLRPMFHLSEPDTRSGEREGKSPHFLACARVWRFLLFSLHLFTFWGQSVVNQMHVCEGFTPFSFTGEVLKRPSPSPATYLLSVG